MKEVKRSGGILHAGAGDSGEGHKFNYWRGKQRQREDGFSYLWEECEIGKMCKGEGGGSVHKGPLLLHCCPMPVSHTLTDTVA